MKTLKQVQNKIKYLKKRLQSKTICENFGSREQDQLALYVGFLWDYDYDLRQQISAACEEFSDWCMNYTTN